MKKLLLLIIICFSLPCLAAEVSQDIVFQVATTQLASNKSQVPAGKAGALGITGIRELTTEENNNTIAYILDLAPKGFIIIAADTDIRPVIAYSFNNNFNYNNTPDNTLLKLLRTDIPQRLAAIPVTNPEIIAANNSLWEDYSQGSSAFIEKLSSVEQWPSDRDGWITTQWGQDGFCNDECPIDPTTGVQCYTGCVATSFAQVLNYWFRPISIEFTSNDNYVTSSRNIYINAANASLMNFNYNSGSPSYSDIARLMFACGVVLQSNYTSSYTTGDVAAIDDILVGKFGFESSSQIDGTAANFYPTLTDNMKNGRPAILAITISGTAGHSVVADGYKSSGEYHLNYGSYGYGDGWYFLPEGMGLGYNTIIGGILEIYPGSRRNASYQDDGHVYHGVTTPATTWYLAEGYTGESFETWICIQNPNSTPAPVILEFMSPTSTFTVYDTINATSRQSYGSRGSHQPRDLDEFSPVGSILLLAHGTVPPLRLTAGTGKVIEMSWISCPRHPVRILHGIQHRCSRNTTRGSSGSVDRSSATIRCGSCHARPTA